MRVFSWLLVLTLIALTFAVDPKCSEKQQVECQDDINLAYPVCKKAA